MARTNFLVHIHGKDFSIKPSRFTTNRFSLGVSIPGRDGIGWRKSSFRMECMPMADGSIEIRVWAGDKFLLVKERIYYDLIDWSIVDGRTISKEQRLKDKRKRKKARSMLEEPQEKKEYAIIQDQ